MNKTKEATGKKLCSYGTMEGVSSSLKKPPTKSFGFLDISNHSDFLACKRILNPCTPFFYPIYIGFSYQARQNQIPVKNILNTEEGSYNSENKEKSYANSLPFKFEGEKKQEQTDLKTFHS